MQPVAERAGCFNLMAFTCMPYRPNGKKNIFQQSTVLSCVEQVAGVYILSLQMLGNHWICIQFLSQANLAICSGDAEIPLSIEGENFTLHTVNSPEYKTGPRVWMMLWCQCRKPDCWDMMSQLSEPCSSVCLPLMAPLISAAQTQKW